MLLKIFSEISGRFKTFLKEPGRNYKVTLNKFWKKFENFEFQRGTNDNEYSKIWAKFRRNFADILKKCVNVRKTWETFGKIKKMFENRY